MSSLALVIGNKNYSSWSLRPWLALRVSGLAFEETRVPLYQADTAAKLKQ
jgi:glutathione S-transferase